MSAARGACASCGGIAPLGSQHLYMYPRSPGAVLRCATCQDVLMVVVHAGGSYRLALQGLTWLEMPDSVEAATEPCRGGHARDGTVALIPAPREDCRCQMSMGTDAKMTGLGPHRMTHDRIWLGPRKPRANEATGPWQCLCGCKLGPGDSSPGRRSS